MRVVHLSTFDRIGGACIAAYRQHEALCRAQVDSTMYVGTRVTNDPAVVAFGPSNDTASRISRFARRRKINKAQRQSAVSGEFFDFRSEFGANVVQSLPRADIYNIQFAHGFLDQVSFWKQLDPSTPVVVTLHEMSPFTGGCSYSGSCERFKGNCGNCPQVARPSANDYSRANWSLREQAYSTRPSEKLHFVADSNWIAEQARQSGLLKDHEITVIHYGLDTEVFTPCHKEIARKLLGIPEGRPVIGFAAASIEDPRKGIRQLREALTQTVSDPLVVCWGKGFPYSLGDKVDRYLGGIADEHLLAAAYNAIDIFVMPSIEEAFGQTALEAVACGTPVVAFAAGGITDTVKDQETGLLVETGDSAGLATAIDQLTHDPSLRLALGRCGRERAEACFSYRANANKYIELYRSLLNADGSNG
ncbi:MAG: glycosyltransferase [Planctomycetota bacterium]